MQRHLEQRHSGNEGEVDSSQDSVVVADGNEAVQPDMHDDVHADGEGADTAGVAPRKRKMSDYLERLWHKQGRKGSKPSPW